MKAFSLSTLLSLTGLIMDIVGAFYLSIEAIGLKTISLWAVRYFEFPWIIIRDEKYRPEMAKKFPTIGRLVKLITFIIVVIGIGLGIKIANLLSHSLPAGKLWWMLFVITLSPFLYVALFIRPILIKLLKRIVKFLSRISEQHLKGEAGIIGFLLIVIGFMLQFLGTLFSAL